MQHNLIAVANTCTQMYSDPIQTTCSTINNQQSLVATSDYCIEMSSIRHI